MSNSAPPQPAALVDLRAAVHELKVWIVVTAAMVAGVAIVAAKLIP